MDQAQVEIFNMSMSAIDIAFPKVQFIEVRQKFLHTQFRLKPKAQVYFKVHQGNHYFQVYDVLVQRQFMLKVFKHPKQGDLGLNHLLGTRRISPYFFEYFLLQFDNQLQLDHIQLKGLLLQPSCRGVKESTTLYLGFRGDW